MFSATGKVIPCGLSTIHTLVSNSHPPRLLGPSQETCSSQAHGLTPDTCESPICNIEHKLELPNLVLLLPLLIFLFVTILLGPRQAPSPQLWCHLGEDRPNAHSCTPKTVPRKGLTPPSTGDSEASGKHTPPPARDSCPQGFNQQGPLSVLSREGCSGPGAPPPPSQDHLGKWAGGGTVKM